MRTIRTLLAIAFAMAAIRLVARRDDARSLRIVIPLTIAAITAMEQVSPRVMATHRDKMREGLAKVRLKLARLEGTESTLG